MKHLMNMEGFLLGKAGFLENKTICLPTVRNRADYPTILYTILYELQPDVQ